MIVFVNVNVIGDLDGSLSTISKKKKGTRKLDRTLSSPLLSTQEEQRRKC